MTIPVCKSMRTKPNSWITAHVYSKLLSLSLTLSSLHGVLKSYVTLSVWHSLTGEGEAVCYVIHLVHHAYVILVPYVSACNAICFFEAEKRSNLKPSIQPHRGTRSSDVVILARPPSSSSLKVNNRSFRHASACLWNHLPKELRQPADHENLIVVLLMPVNARRGVMLSV